MSSIRGRGVDTIVVQPRKVVRGRAGHADYIADGPPFKMKQVDVQSVREWATANEDVTNGLTLNILFRLFVRSWPTDEAALVFYDGGIYEIVGGVQKFNRTPKTKHSVLTLKWLGNGVAPSVP